jgi:Fe-S-cluster containining protein
VTVSLELEWVLRASFAFAKTEVVRTFSALLSSSELGFESEGALEVASVEIGTATPKRGRQVAASADSDMQWARLSITSVGSSRKGRPDTLCPFLVDHVCSIYEARPFVCRDLAVFDVNALTCSRCQKPSRHLTQ